MMKYKNLYGKEYNRTNTSSLANSLCLLFGLSEMNIDSGVYVDLLNCAGRVNKAVIYCPLSVAEWVVESQPLVKERIEKIAPLQIGAVTKPSRNSLVPVCSMLSGENENKKSVKNKTNASIFEILQKAGRKCLLISSDKKTAEYYENKVATIKVSCGTECLNNALERIKNKEYDFIFIVDNDYSDVIKTSLPLSKLSKKTLDSVVDKFELLSDAIDVYPQGDVLLGFCPDKGCSAFFLGSKSGSISIAETNVSHFFAVKGDETA